MSIYIYKNFTSFVLKRILARLIDYSLTFCFLILAHSLFAFAFSPLYLILLTPFCTMLTDILLLSSSGTTIGKRICGFEVKTHDQKKLSFLASCKRAGMQMIKTLVFPFLYKEWRLLYQTQRTSWDFAATSFCMISKKHPLKQWLSALCAFGFISFSTYMYTEGEIQFARIDYEMETNQMLNWKQFSDQNKQITIRFPSKPKETSTELAIPDSDDTLPYNELIYQDKEENIHYSVSYSTLPQQWLKWGSSLVLKGVLKVVAKHSGKANITYQYSSKYQNYPALDYIYASKQGETLGRMILVKDNIYKVEVMTPHHMDDEAKQLAITYLNTLKIA